MGKYRKTLMTMDDRAVFQQKSDDSIEMEVAQESGEDARGNPRYTVYRFPIDQIKKHVVDQGALGKAVYLVPLNYEPSWPHPVESYEEWFAKDLHKVAQYASIDTIELVNALCAKDWKLRQEGYFLLGSYQGFQNFDTEPDTDVTAAQLRKRWR